jgi:mannose-6-phosphate isomerase class I
MVCFFHQKKHSYLIIIFSCIKTLYPSTMLALKLYILKVVGLAPGNVVYVVVSSLHATEEIGAMAMV